MRYFISGGAVTGSAILGLLLLLGLVQRHEEGVAAKEEKPVIQTRNWPTWRGPMQNGISLERDLPDKFDPTKANSNVIWQSDVGGGPTPLLIGDRAYLTTTPGH